MTEKACDCMPDHPEYRIEHYASEHKNDCTESWYGGINCGGCMRCIASQQWYYFTLYKESE